MARSQAKSVVLSAVASSIKKPKTQHFWPVTRCPGRQYCTFGTFSPPGLVRDLAAPKMSYCLTLAIGNWPGPSWPVFGHPLVRVAQENVGNRVGPSWPGFGHPGGDWLMWPTRPPGDWRGDWLMWLTRPPGDHHLGRGTRAKVNDSTALLARPGPKCSTVRDLCVKAPVFGRTRGQNANDSVTLFELAPPKPSTILHF